MSTLLRSILSTPDLRALTVRQPWAQGLLGPKDVENRPMRTHRRGWVLLHTSARRPSADDLQIAASRGFVPTILPEGQIIGAIEIVDCVEGHASVWAVPGEFHWVIGRRYRLSSATPAKGALGFWRVSESLRRSIGQSDMAPLIIP